MDEEILDGPEGTEEPGMQTEDVTDPFEDIRQPDGRYKLTVDGEDKLLGPSELRAQLQKEMAGDRKLRDSARLSESADLGDLTKSAFRGDVNSYFQLAERLGVDEDDAQALLDGFSEGDEDDFEDEEEDDGEEGRVVQKWYERPKTKEEQQREEWIEQQRIEAIRSNIFGSMQEGLTSDPELNRIIEGDEQKANALWKITESITRRMIGMEGQPWDVDNPKSSTNAATRARILDEVRGFAKEIGLVSTGKKSPTGFGRAPSYLDEQPYAPSQRKEIKERPDSTTSSYDDWFDQGFERYLERSMLEQ